MTPLSIHYSTHIYTPLSSHEAFFFSCSPLLNSAPMTPTQHPLLNSHLYSTQLPRSLLFFLLPATQLSSHDSTQYPLVNSHLYSTQLPRSLFFFLLPATPPSSHDSTQRPLLNSQHWQQHGSMAAWQQLLFALCCSPWFVSCLPLHGLRASI